MQSVDPLERNGPGLIGVICERETIEKVVRKTQRGPLWRAKCNRWYLHDGDHRQTDLRTYRVLFEWTEKDCAEPDPNRERRKEMALAKRLVEDGK